MYTGLVDYVISQRNDLHRSCNSCREIGGKMRALMRQSRSGFRGLIVGFRKQNDQLTVLDTQFNRIGSRIGSSSRT